MTNELEQRIVDELTKDGRLVLTTAEVGRLLDTTDDRVRKWCHDPESGFPCIFVGRNIRVPKQELLEWLHNEIERQRTERMAQRTAVRRNIPKIY